MQPNQPNTNNQKEVTMPDNQGSASSAPPAIDDNYANALANMVTMESQLKEKQTPEIEHFISKKILVYIIISIIISIIGVAITGTQLKSSGPEQSEQDTINQLLDTKQELNDLKSSY